MVADHRASSMDARQLYLICCMSEKVSARAGSRRKRSLDAVLQLVRNLRTSSWGSMYDDATYLSHQKCK